MSDYDTAADAAEDNLEEQGPVEEIQVGNRRIKFGAAEGQVKSLAMLRGLAARQRNGVCQLAKTKTQGEDP